MIDRLEATLKRYNEIGEELSNPEVISDIKKMTALSKERTSLEKTAYIYKEYKKVLDDIEEAKELLHDKDMAEFAKEELSSAEDKKIRLENVKELKKQSQEKVYNEMIAQLGEDGMVETEKAREAKRILSKDNYKVISCHIGNGGSICAIKDGKCIDTSMGFTPLAGIMMGTRSGDVDPSIIPYIMEKEGKNASEVIDDLNKNSGLYGMSEFSNDMRDIVARIEEGDHRALIAREKYVRRIVDYIAQYYVLLEGVDMIALTAGVGENNKIVRREILEKLACLGVKIDTEANEVVGEEIKLSASDSKILVYVIPTDEELMIAKDTYNLINNR